MHAIVTIYLYTVNFIWQIVKVKWQCYVHLRIIFFTYFFRFSDSKNTWNANETIYENMFVLKMMFPSTNLFKFLEVSHNFPFPSGKPFWTVSSTWFLGFGSPSNETDKIYMYTTCRQVLFLYILQVPVNLVLKFNKYWVHIIVFLLQSKNNTL